MMYSLILLLVCVACTFGWVKEMENAGLYQGDMVLTPEELMEANSGMFGYSSLGDKRKMWPKSVVPYVIDSTLSNELEAVAAIKAAMEEYKIYTCITFIKRTNERGYISMYKGSGCSSRVGYSGTRMSVSLSKGCWSKSTVMHEIGHALGLHHEQTRPDRDNYVEIMTNNINSGVYFNFKKQKNSNINSHGTQYDYLSMMHYSWNAFAINSDRPSIRTLNPDYQYHIGQETGFSRLDVVQLNQMYKCYKTIQPPEYKIIRGCYDLSGGCTKLASEGKCDVSSWRNHMTNKCRRSCKLCGDGGVVVTQGPFTRGPVITDTPVVTPSTGTGGGSCTNRVNDCITLGKHRCNDPRQFWRDYMKRSCKKYCNFC